MVEDYFITYDAKKPEVALAAYSKALDSVVPVVHRTKGTTIFQNVYPGISMRDGFNRHDYEDVHQDDYIPEDDKGIIAASLNAYKNVGIVKNTIDLMTDLVVQGMDVVHPIRSQERFFKRWFHEVVQGLNRSERATSIIYRGGTAILKRQMATISVQQLDEMKKVSGAVKREIPWQYTILNPLSVEVIRDDLVDFIDVKQRQYGLTLSRGLVEAVRNMDKHREFPFLRSIPSDLLAGIRQAIRTNKHILPLDNDKLAILSYKKDDWEVWAKPICHAILEDLQMYQKMKLADVSALNGAISQIRLWKLGDLQNKLFPNAAAFAKLASILMNVVPGSVADVMWGPAIVLEETGTDLHHFLGETKYTPVLKAIFSGLGLPSALSGYGDQGFTNNMVEIKVLIQRLKYVRKLLVDFWQGEFKLIQKAMGFDKPASLVFDYSLLDDEASILNVLLSAVDRNLISNELFQERAGAVPEIESVRIKRQWKNEQSGKIPPKASQFHNPDADDTFKKDLYKHMVETGQVDPSQVLEQVMDEDVEELDLKSVDEVIEMNKPPAPQPGNRTGKPNGRPPSSKDKVKRKQKIVKPIKSQVNFVKTMLWAEVAQKKISEVFTPYFLKVTKKDNARQLSDAEAKQLETAKFYILCELQPHDDFTEEKFRAILKTPPQGNQLANSLLHNCIVSYTDTYGSEPPVEKLRNMQSKIVALIRNEESNFSGSGTS